MLLDKISIIPAVIFSAAALVSWVLYTQAPGGSAWVRVLMYYAPWFFGTWAGISAGAWLSDFVLRLVNSHVILVSQVLDLAARLTTEQRYFAVWALGGDVESPATGAAPIDPDLIPLHTGDTVFAPAVMRLAEGRRGDNLPAERSIHDDRKLARETYNKLAQAGAIQKGSPVDGPKIINPQLFEQIITQAQAKS